MHRVKYTRKEYREEYLKSEEWKSLRNLVLSSSPGCQCCKKRATEVHHMTYRNIVDIKITDLLPVCRACHNLIHDAIKDGYIDLSPENLEDNKRKSLSLNEDKEYADYRKWLTEKHFLDKGSFEFVYTRGNNYLFKKICALTKKRFGRTKDLEKAKFTGRQIEKIHNLIKNYKYREENKISRNKKRRRNSPLEDIFLFKRKKDKSNELFN